MKPRIPHHKVVPCAWEWSIHYSSLSAMLTPLHSSMNKEVFEKYICNHCEKYNGTIHFPYLSAMFNSLHSSTDQELFEKHLCNKGSHYENTPLRKASHHVQINTFHC